MNGMTETPRSVLPTFGDVSYTIESASEENYATPHTATGGTGAPARGHGYTQHWYSKTQGGVEVESQTSDRQVWSWEQLAGGKSVFGVTPDQSAVPYAVPALPADEVWSKVELRVDRSAKARGLFNAPGQEYEYSSEDRNNIHNVTTPGAKVGNYGYIVEVVAVDGFDYHHYAAKDWAGRENGERQGTLTADLKSERAFSSTSTTTTSMMDGAVWRVGVASKGHVNGTDSADIQSTEFRDTRVNESNWSKVRVDRTLKTNGTSHADGSADFTLEPAAAGTAPSELRVTAGTWKDHSDAITFVDTDRVRVTIDFRRSASASSDPCSQGNYTPLWNGRSTFEKSVTQGVLSTKGTRTLVRANGQATEDRSTGETGFDRTESTVHDVRVDSERLTNTAAGGSTRAVGELKTRGESDGTYDDGTDWTFDALTGVFVSTDTWDHSGTSGRTASDKGQAVLTPPRADDTPKTTDYESGNDLRGPVTSDGTLKMTFTPSPAAALVGGVAGSVAEELTSNDFVSVAGTISGKTTATAANEFTRAATTSTTYGDGDTPTARSRSRSSPPTRAPTTPTAAPRSSGRPTTRAGTPPDRAPRGCGGGARTT